MIYLILLIASVASFCFGFGYYGYRLVGCTNERLLSIIAERDLVRSRVKGEKLFLEEFGIICKCKSCNGREIFS